MKEFLDVNYTIPELVLAPTEHFNKDGVYSGSALEVNGKLNLIYTGNVKNKDNLRTPYQCVVECDKEGKLEKEKVIIKSVPKGYTTHFRDPKAFKKDNIYYFVIGAQNDNLKGRALLYSSKDFENWNLEGEIKTKYNDFGYMWECPNLININGKDIFIFSPQGLEKEEFKYQNIYQSGYIFVAIDENGERNFEFNRGCDGDYSFESIDLSKIGKNDIIHFGSATGFLEGKLKETYFKLLDYAKENNIFVSFDPNYRDALITEEKLEDFISDSKEFIKKADFIKLSDEEVLLITKEKDIESGVKKLHEIGAKVVAITLGAKGTLISNGEEMEVVPSVKIKQVDSTGAGDSFVGGVFRKISELENNKNISFEKWKDIIAYGNKVGAFTCTNYGAIASMPTEKDLEIL